MYCHWTTTIQLLQHGRKIFAVSTFKGSRSDLRVAHWMSLPHANARITNSLWFFGSSNYFVHEMIWYICLLHGQQTCRTCTLARNLSISRSMVRACNWSSTGRGINPRQGSQTFFSEVSVWRTLIYNSWYFQTPTFINIINNNNSNENNNNYNNNNKKASERVVLKIEKRVKILTELELYDRNMIRSSNCRVIPVAGYPMYVCKFAKADLRELDTVLKKWLKTKNMLGRQSSDERLYVKRQMGGRGLKSLKEVYQETKLRIATYMSRSEPR